jgi:chaperonin GroES
MTKGKPLNDKVLIERVEAVSATKGGIIIPDNVKEKPAQGKVLAVGEGRRDQNGNRIPIDLKEGDVVIFGKYAGIEVKLNEETYFIMAESEILMKLEEQ